MGDQPDSRSSPTHRTTRTQNKSTQRSMPRAGFEPVSRVFELVKMVYALDRSATVTGAILHCSVWQNEKLITGSHKNCIAFNFHQIAAEDNVYSIVCFRWCTSSYVKRCTVVLGMLKTERKELLVSAITLKSIFGYACKFGWCSE
jgi:hypothetical protein